MAFLQYRHPIGWRGAECLGDGFRLRFCIHRDPVWNAPPAFDPFVGGMLAKRHD